ncbi:MAG: hypothetical protein IJ347_06970 [Faecalibacterium sp.]|nr:hypothetical protein [Faecalibacterium sp.]
MSEKSMRLAQVLGGIDEQLVADALQNSRAAAGQPRRKYAMLAACVCLLSAAILVWSGGDRGERWFPVERLELDGLFGEQSASSSTATAPIPQWDERSLVDQYPSIDNDWTRTGAVLPADVIGTYRKTITLTGYDDYHPEAEHTIRAELYDVIGLSPDCVLALRYESTDEYYCFVSHSYRPETLGQLWQDLNLSEQAQFSTAHYDYQKVYGLHANVTLTGVTTELVHRQLVAPCGDAVNTHSDTMWLQLPAADEIDLRIDLPLLGIRNMGLRIREDGYLTTNLLATGKTFFIGPERAQTFITGLKETLEGSEVLYPYQEISPQNAGEDEWGGDASVPPAE